MLDTDETDTSSDGYEYAPATPTHSSTGSNSPEELAQNILTNLGLELSPNDPYMQAYNGYMQAYGGNIPTVPTITPTPPKPHYTSQDRYVPEIDSPPLKKIRFIPPSPPPRFNIGSSSYKTPLERHDEQIDEILSHLDKLSLERMEEVETRIRELGIGRNRLENELEKTRNQIFRLQTKYEGHSDEVSTAHVRLSTIEMIIEDLRDNHRSDIDELLEAIQDLKSNLEQK